MEDVRNLSPFFEGIKAASLPFAKGVVKGLIIGVPIGLLAAGLFWTLGEVVPGIYATVEEVSAKTFTEKGILHIMHDFIPAPVQVAFASVINAASLAIMGSQKVFRERYAEVENAQNTLFNSPSIEMEQSQNIAVENDSPEIKVTEFVVGSDGERQLLNENISAKSEGNNGGCPAGCQCESCRGKAPKNKVSSVGDAELVMDQKQVLLDNVINLV